MIRFHLLLAFSLLFIGLTAPTASIALAQPKAASISVDEIKPGMKGYGLTVFRGTKPERFDVEVIDVLKNFRPDQDLILIRTHHPVLKHAKVVAGMSGSPVYLDGRLAGAYAYGWNFGNDPMAGVTPIANMRTELRRPTRPKFGEKGYRKRAKQIAGYLDPNRTAWSPLRELDTTASLRTTQGITFRATTPISVGGFTDEVTRYLAKELEPYGLTVLQAGGSGAGAAADGPTRFENGSSIAVQLIRGDISMAGTGTVTEVAGKRLIAFGHPMMNAGEVRLPVATSKVLHILSSQRSSFKIAQALTPMGTLIHDRQSAIVVDTTMRADTIPVRIKINGVAGAPKTEWNVEVAVHSRLTPLLIFSALANAISATESGQEPVVISVDSQVKIKGHRQLNFRDSGFTLGGPGDMGTLASVRAFAAIEAALLNPFEETEVERVDLTLDVKYGRDATEILGASIGVGEVDPGSRVPIFVRLRHLDEPERTEVLFVDIPKRSAGKTLKVDIAAGNATRVVTPIPDDLEGIFQTIEKRFNANQLVATVTTPSRAMQYRGHVIGDLPHSAASALHLTHNTADLGKKLSTTSHVAKNARTILFGKASLKISVRDIAKDLP